LRAGARFLLVRAVRPVLVDVFFPALPRLLADARFGALPLGVLAPAVRRPVFFARLRLGPAPLFAAARRAAPDFFADGLFRAFDPLPFAFAMRSPLT
jgi:hypothetical protein